MNQQIGNTDGFPLQQNDHNEQNDTENENQPSDLKSGSARDRAQDNNKNI